MCYVWFFLMFASFYFHEIHQIVPALGVFFLWLWWESLEYRKMIREDKRNREEFERLNPELAEEEREEREACRIKQAIKEKEAKELDIAKRLEDHKRTIEEFEKICIKSKL